MRSTAKDRLIIALGAQLRAERETRDALAAVIANGQLDRDVLHAILSDPIPVVTQEDLAHAEAVAKGSMTLGAGRPGASLRDAA